MKPADPVAVIEAAYRVEIPKREWLGALAAKVDGLMGVGSGSGALLYDTSGGAWVGFEGMQLCGSIKAEFVLSLCTPSPTREVREALATKYSELPFALLRKGPFPPSSSEALGRLLDRAGLEDVACLNAIDPTFHGCLMVAVTRSQMPTERTLRAWRRVAAHVAAGARLRRTLAALGPNRAPELDGIEAVLGPRGRVEHAVGPARDPSSRELLREGVSRIELARSRSVDPDRALGTWEALVAGRWSLVEHVDAAGTRRYVAHRNDPRLTDEGVLSERERQVLGYAKLGHSSQLIAYSLGLPPATVSAVLGSARRKLAPLAEAPRHQVEPSLFASTKP